MFVHRTHGVVAATLGVLLAAGACTDPAQNTDLRPEGPPEVLAVLVMTDASAQLVEKATFCKTNDDKRPGLVGLPDATTQQVCPDDLAKPATEVDSAYPDGWYVRVMFDELLDPSVETLTEILDDTGAGTGTFEGSIASTKPVKLECENLAGSMIEIDYDGYYSPSGNHVTWPVGPSLVIKPNDPTLIASGTPCQVTINSSVVDKDNTKVPDNQRGPYKFGVASIGVIAIDPPDDPDGKSPIHATQIYVDNVYLQFNTAVYSQGANASGALGNILGICDDVDLSGLGFVGLPFFPMCDQPVFSFEDTGHPAEGPGLCNTTGSACGSLADCGTGDTVCGKGLCSNGNFDTPCNTAADCATGETCETTYTYNLFQFGLTQVEYAVSPLNPIETERNYTFGITPGAKFKDRCGRTTTITDPNVDDMTLTHFSTDKFDFGKFNIADGEQPAPIKKPDFNMTNIVAPDPTVFLSTYWDLTPLPVGAGGAVLTKDQLLKSAGDGGIMFQGNYALGTEYTFTLHAGAVITDVYGKTFTNPAEKVVHWKTAPAILLTSTSPADKGTVTKALTTSSAGVSLNFNQAMDPTTLDAADYTVTDSAGNPVTMAATTVSGCGLTSTTCGLRVRKAGITPGTYTFTLKAGATMKDVLGNTYTQAADKVVHFTIKDPLPPPATCL